MKQPLLLLGLRVVEANSAVLPGGKWAEEAYEAMAPVYDDFTAHHNYELWLGNLLPILESHGLRGRRLLDVGCGTGKSFLPMLGRGWDVTACDISASMLELAAAKAGDLARLAVADMRELPVFGEFDLVWALDDAVNYLLSPGELGEALGGMAANLAPGGLLMFDVNTLECYRTFFAETERVERGGRRLLWRGQSTPDAQPGCIAEAHLEVQRHFPEAEVLAQIEGAGLECVYRCGHGYDAVPQQPLEELVHTKAVYISHLA
jgi:SAM-dependent methyltransferase